MFRVEARPALDRLASLSYASEVLSRACWLGLAASLAALLLSPVLHGTPATPGVCVAFVIAFASWGFAAKITAAVLLAILEALRTIKQGAASVQKPPPAAVPSSPRP